MLSWLVTYTFHSFIRQEDTITFFFHFTDSDDSVAILTVDKVAGREDECWFSNWNPSDFILCILVASRHLFRLCVHAEPDEAGKKYWQGYSHSEFKNIDLNCCVDMYIIITNGFIDNAFVFLFFEFQDILIMLWFRYPSTVMQRNWKAP